MSNGRNVDWECVKRCLAVLQRESKAFLGQALLIGGAACWFYRVHLKQAGDIDFFEPALSPKHEALSQGNLPLADQQRMDKLFLSIGRKVPEILADARIGRRVRPLLLESDVASRFIKEQLHLA